MLELSSENARDPRTWVSRLKDGLAKTRSRLSGLFGGGAISPALFEALEAALLAVHPGKVKERIGIRRRELQHLRIETGRLRQRAPTVERNRLLQQRFDGC